MESFAFMPSNLHKKFHILAMNWGLLSNIKLIGRPSLDQTCCINSLAVALADILLFFSVHSI